MHATRVFISQLVMQIQTATFDRRFADLHRRSISLMASVSPDHLFRRPRSLASTMTMFSSGEFVLRSAAAVEQTCGGITTRLWDDPFEWTLPEKLSTPALVSEYLTEVEVTRQKAFLFFRTDEDLMKSIPAPEQLKSIFMLLLETLSRAEHYQGRAFAIFQMYSDEKLPRL